MGNDASKSLSLKVLVDEEKNRVVYAESDNDFMDVLLGFITMPIGTIIRLTREQASKGAVGCLNNLYESIVNLDNKHLQSVKCKDILLRPQSATEIYCKNLKLNFVNSTTNGYYVCSLKCILYPYQTAHCHCGRPIDSIVKLEKSIFFPHVGGVFVKPTSRFMITDDFQVLPMSTMASLMLLKELGAVDGSTLKERCINIGKDEVLKLLKCSLTSMAPFSETLLNSPPANRTDIAISCGESSSGRTNESERALDGIRKEEKKALKVRINRAMYAEADRRNDAKIDLKVIINKCNNRVLYAEADKDFVDLICSFLTFPLSYVFQKFPAFSLMKCLGNLYKSIIDFEVNKYFESEEMKATLVDPKLAPGIPYNKQLIPINEALYPSLSSLFKTSSLKLNSTVAATVATTGEGFMKGPSMFMVMDDLTIRPLSPISGLAVINGLNIAMSDIVEREVTIGEEEALRLLEAALVSGSALTDAFILKEPKQEPRGNTSHLDAGTESKLNGICPD